MLKKLIVDIPLQIKYILEIIMNIKYSKKDQIKIHIYGRNVNLNEGILKINEEKNSENFNLQEV